MEQVRERAAPGQWWRVKGQVAIVTGGARGLGREICEALAEAGASVIAADILYEDTEPRTARTYEDGGQIVQMGLDLTDADQTRDAVARVAERYRQLDILVNNAAIDHTVPIEELDIEQWRRVVDVNLTGPWLMMKHAIPLMRREGRGQIVNIASTASKRAWPNAAAYHATKWGLLGLSHAMHAEARRHGVKVMALVSGGMRTPFLLDRFPGLDEATLQDPRNVAEVVRFMLSLPPETVLPEVMCIPMTETSWP